MKRVLVITAIVVAALGAFIVAAWVGVFHTGAGRSMLAGVIEEQLGAALNSRAEIGAFKGAPPGHIIFENVALSDSEGEWLTVRRAELRWRPLALIRKRIVVDAVSIDSAYLLRNPPPGEKTQKESSKIDLSFNAPNVSVAKLDITDFRTEVGGEMERLDGAGAVWLKGPDINLRFSLTSSGEHDQADIAFEKAPRQDRFFLDAALFAEPEGVIASLLGLKGPLRIEAKGDGAIADARIDLTGRIGSYGDVTAALASNLEDFTGADLNIEFTAGERLAHIRELAAPASLDARLDLDRRGGVLTVHSLNSGVGETAGDVRWRAPGGGVERLTTSLDLQFADSYRPEIQEYLGQTAKLIAQLDWRRSDYALSASIDGERADIEIRNGATDLSRKFAGSVSATMEGRDSLPPIIANGVTANGDIDIDLDQHFRAERLAVVTENGAEFHGQGEYQLADETITATGDFTLAAAALRALTPDIAASGAIAGEFDLEGPADRFTLETNFETPELKFNDSALPPMAVRAALAGLPRLPTGDILATARSDAPRRLEAQLRSSQDGIIRAPKILYTGRGFRLEGAGDFDPEPQTANIDLVYEGRNNAEPWPGLAMTGDAKIKGVLSRDGALNNINIEADTFSVNDISVTGLALAAEGPPGAVNISLSGDTFAAPGLDEMTEYAAEAQVSLQGAPVVTISQFEALIADNPARLTDAAKISLEEGVTIENLRLAYGADGSIALDGMLRPDRWQADANLQNVNIPNADGQITLDLALDTDAETPGRADFSLRSLLLNEEEASLAGSVLWDGESLTLTDDNTDEKIDMRIVFPAKLARAPKINVGMEGPLDGFVRYDGDIQAIAAYLPPTVQTMEGKLTADFNLGGDTSAPNLSGNAALSEGAYTELGSGFSLAGLHAEAEAKYEGGRSVVAFTGGARGAGQSRNDTLTFTGDVAIGDESRVDVAVKLDNAAFSAHPVNNVRANGSFDISGPFDALQANGDIVIEELDAEIISPETTGLVDIEVVAYNDGRQTSPETEPEKKNSDLRYSVKLTADDRIFVRGRGLESEWAANATVVNGREEPVIVGKLNLRRGWLDFAGRRFDLTRGGVTFDLLSVNNPVLDIRAEHGTDEGVTAAIVISGRAREPEITLESTPSLPQEDIMALILFGKPAQNLSPFESLQIAEALASLGGVGPFGGQGLTGRLRTAVGLDLLNVDVDPESGGGALTVGKYVAEGFFVSATQDAEGKSGSVRVKYEITDNITVETEMEQAGDQTVSANWKKDF